MDIDPYFDITGGNLTGFELIVSGSGKQQGLSKSMRINLAGFHKLDSHDRVGVSSLWFVHLFVNVYSTIIIVILHELMAIAFSCTQQAKTLILTATC